MSSTNRGATRNLDDHYATPPDLCRLICETLRDDGWIEEPMNLLEPGCGEGFFLDAMAETWPYAEIEGVDLNPDLVALARERGHNVRQGDVLGTDWPDFSGIIGNPPFKEADEFIDALLPSLDPNGRGVAAGTLAFILRLNYLGGKERYRRCWSKRPPSHVYVLPARAGFTPDGRTDSVEYGVFVWRHGHVGPTTLSHLDNTRISNKWAGATISTRRHGVERPEARLKVEDQA